MRFRYNGLAKINIQPFSLFIPSNGFDRSPPGVPLMSSSGHGGSALSRCFFHSLHFFLTLLESSSHKIPSTAKYSWHPPGHCPGITSEAHAAGVGHRDNLRWKSIHPGRVRRQPPLPLPLLRGGPLRASLGRASFTFRRGPHPLYR